LDGIGHLRETLQLTSSTNIVDGQSRWFNTPPQLSLNLNFTNNPIFQTVPNFVLTTTKARKLPQIYPQTSEYYGGIGSDWQE
jgi:hypothetical protein